MSKTTQVSFLLTEHTLCQEKIPVLILQSFQSLHLARGFAISFILSLQREQSAFWHCELFRAHIFVGFER